MDPIEELLLESEKDRFAEAVKVAKLNNTRLVFSNNGVRTEYHPSSIDLSKIEKLNLDD